MGTRGTRKDVKTVAFVHQPGAGEQLTEAMLRAALSDELRVCAFRRDAGCCDAAPCKRWSEFDRAGYRLHLLKDAEGASLPSAGTGDANLVQLREPTLRALGLYSRELAQHGRRHSIELLQSWLSAEAVRTVDFHKAWGNDAPRRLVLRYEALIKAPREAFDAVLTDAGLQIDDAALERAVAEAGRASDRAAEVSLGVLEADANFVRPLFAEYMNLLNEEVGYQGYAPWTDVKPASGPVTTLYRARRARRDGNFEEVVAQLTPFVAVNAVEPEIRVLLAEALLETGRDLEGRRALEIVFKTEPEYLEGHAVLARHAYRQGLATEGRAILREAMARRGGAAWTRALLESAKLDADLLGEFAGHTEPPLGRDAVIGGFSWILGREPESEAVIEVHRLLHDRDDLRSSLLRSEEFRRFHARFEAGEENLPPDISAQPLRDDVLTALHWLLGRPPRSREEAEGFLASQSREELRLMLVGSDEFRRAYGHLAEGT
jgi:hypothetical protein